MHGLLDISTSGLVANRIRLETAAANAANAHSLFNAAGEYEPYRRRAVELAAGSGWDRSSPGVRVAAIAIDQGPLPMRYEPASPYADKNGYLSYPNVDPLIEQTNAMEAWRAYEANMSAIETTKSMISAALQMMA